MKIKIEERQLAIFILTTGITLNYVVDGLNKICSIYLPILSRSAIIYRALLQLFCISIIIFFINKQRVVWLLTFLYFLICFFVGNLYLKHIGGVEIHSIEQFIYFNKYFFIFFLFFAVYKVLKDRSLLLVFIENFKKIFLFNGCLALLGLFFKIKLFYITPLGTSRFGYDGLVISGNEASIFYLLGLFVFYFDWRWRDFKKSKYALIAAVLFCLLTGMKAVLLGVFLLFCFHLFSTLSVKKLAKIFLAFFALVLILIQSLPKLRVIFGYYYYRLDKQGFIYMFTGGRNTFIESRVIPFLKKWDIINYLIGGQNISNVDNFLSLTEMDFIDIFLFFGLVNGIIFVLLYKTAIVGKIKNKFYLFCVFSFLLLSFFAGHFFTSSVNPIYIIIVFSYLNCSVYEFYKKV